MEFVVACAAVTLALSETPTVTAVAYIIKHVKTNYVFSEKHTHYTMSMTMTMTQRTRRRTHFLLMVVVMVVMA